MQGTSALKDKRYKFLDIIKNRYAIFVLVAALLVGCGLAYYAVVKDGSAVSVWLDAEKESLVFTSHQLNIALGEDFSVLGDTLGSTPWSLSAKLSGSLKEGDLGLSARHLKMVEQVLGRGVLNIEAKAEPENELLYGDASLSVYGISLLGGRFFRQNELIGFRAPRIFDNYLTFQGDGLGNALRLFEPEYRGPERLQVPSGLYTGLDILLNHLENLVQDDFVRAEKCEAEEVTIITLSLSEDELATLWLGLKKEVENDVVLRDLADGFSATLRLLALVPDIKDWFRSFLNGVAEILEGGREASFPSGLEMVLRLDKEKRIVERSLVMGLAAISPGPQDSGNAVFATLEYQTGKNVFEYGVEGIDGGMGSGSLAKIKDNGTNFGSLKISSGIVNGNGIGAVSDASPNDMAITHKRASPKNIASPTKIVSFNNMVSSNNMASSNNMVTDNSYFNADIITNKSADISTDINADINADIDIFGADVNVADFYSLSEDNESVVIDYGWKVDVSGDETSSSLQVSVGVPDGKGYLDNYFVMNAERSYYDVADNSSIEGVDQYGSNNIFTRCDSNLVVSFPPYDDASAAIFCRRFF